MKQVLLLLVLSLVCISGWAQDSEIYTDYPTESENIYDICFTQSGEVLAIADNSSVRAFAVSSKELIWEFENGHTDHIMSLDISPDSTLMVTGGRDSLVVIWDFINRQKLDLLTFHQGLVNSVVFSPDRSSLASGGSDKKVIIYDFLEKKIHFELTPGDGEISSVAFSPDGALLACSGENRIISIYDMQTGSRVAELSGHKDWVREVKFSSNGKRLISCGDDSQVITWNCIKPQNTYQISSRRIGMNWLLSADFHTDNFSFAVGGFNGKVNLVTPFNTFVAKVNSPVTRVRFKPNKGMLLTIAVATRGNGVWLIDVKKLEPRK
ncbi:MAG: WD40 repeat domain-containing protein [Bacteroidales bacterium]|nr:WD40 repeat domain-containing protein [Bacteroidales bacterium]